MAYAMQVDFHPEATTELSESSDWYAERSSRAARDFLVAVDVAIASIANDPQRFVHIDDRHKSCSVIKFPFQVVCRVVDDRIVVVAIAHAKRRPGYWRGLVTHRSPNMVFTQGRGFVVGTLFG
jgi:plasmid stabilization system protein ParE